MAKVNPENTAKLLILDHNDQIFRDTHPYDLAFYINSEQKMHIGPYHFGSNSVIVLERDNVKINGDMEYSHVLTGNAATFSNVFVHHMCRGDQSTWSNLDSRYINTSNISISGRIEAEKGYIQDIIAQKGDVMQLTASNIESQYCLIDNGHMCNLNVATQNIYDDLHVGKHLYSETRTTLCNDTYCQNVNINGNLDLDNFIGFSKNP